MNTRKIVICCAVVGLLATVGLGLFGCHWAQQTRLAGKTTDSPAMTETRKRVADLQKQAEEFRKDNEALRQRLATRPAIPPIVPSPVTASVNPAIMRVIDQAGGGNDMILNLVVRTGEPARRHEINANRGSAVAPIATSRRVEAAKLHWEKMVEAADEAARTEDGSVGRNGAGSYSAGCAHRMAQQAAQLAEKARQDYLRLLRQ